jgi:2',3'-cyclic-nucleotide 2'-phosphodiesterase (5'-nucleotidase family)
MTIKKRIKDFVFVFFFFFLQIHSPLLFASSKGGHFVILHTNDLHGHLLPYFVKDEKGQTHIVGGLDVLAGYVDRIRKNNPVLLLDAGDISQGTPVSNLFYGKPMAEAMNAMQYTAAEVGNHEFDWGLKHLQTFIHRCHFPILAANVLEKIPHQGWEELPYTKPDLLETIGGINVGIIGVVTPATPFISKPENMKDLRFLEPAPVVQKYIRILKAKGAQIIIVLSHLGVEDDQALAKVVPDIDLIIGGHSHTVLQKPIQVGRTLIVQTGSYCRYLGEIQVDMIGNIPHFDYHLIPIQPGAIQPDIKVSLIMKTYQKKVAPLMSRPICILKNDLTRSWNSESTLGDAIADALRSATGTEAAFQNAGGIRADLLSGIVRWGDVYTVLPFDDNVVTMDLKGSDILSLLNHSISGKQGLLQVSGLKYVFEKKEENGKTTATLQGVWIEGKPLDPNATYHIATSDFLATGGDGFEAFKHGTHVRYGSLLREVFMHYLKAHSPFFIYPQGRIVVHETAKIPG